jgi:ABC-type branched-subunit amino acid transport system permease subunit
MRGPSIRHIVLVVAVLAAVPLLTASNVVLNFLVVALLIALVGQGWNVLGGYGGQYSFGHAAFFGTGAYATAILQMRYGVNAWIAFALGIVGGGGIPIAVEDPQGMRTARREWFRLAGPLQGRAHKAHHRSANHPGG